MKKLLALLLATCLLVSPIASQADQSTSQYNAVLALSALRYSVCTDLLASQRTVFEMDQSGDGVINALDALYILQIAVDKRTPAKIIEYKPEVFACIEECHVAGAFSVAVLSSYNDTELLFRWDDLKDLVLPEPEYFETHTLLGVQLTKDCPAGYVPASVFQSGNRLLVGLQWQSGEAVTGDHVYLIAIPKVQATVANLYFQNLPEKPQAFVTTTVTYLGNWWEPTKPPIAATEINDEVALEKVALVGVREHVQKNSYAYSSYAEAYELVRGLYSDLEIQFTDGFFEQYRTVAVRYSGKGHYELWLDSISPDGEIVLSKRGTPQINGDNLTGATSSDLVLIHIPRSESMPDAYTVVIQKGIFHPQS